MSTGYTGPSRPNLQPTFLISDIRTLALSSSSSVEAYRPTQHMIGHFRDDFLQAR